jgi:isopentenyl diphosphate isomerase/L-lactate dehydrogenase-like FMN-dependent dehydrogenase
LAVEGEAGVEAVFTELRDELARAMALCGVGVIGEIDRSLIKSE